MSRSASITIELARPASPCRLVGTFLDAGWSYNHYGEIRYLPLGDRDSFDWQFAPLDTWSTVWETLEAKEQKRELIGVGLSWREAGIGGTFLLRRSRRLSVILDADRPRLEGCGVITDMSWYLLRLVAPLVAGGHEVRSVTCVDHD